MGGSNEGKLLVIHHWPYRMLRSGDQHKGRGYILARSCLGFPLHGGHLKPPRRHGFFSHSIHRGAF